MYNAPKEGRGNTVKKLDTNLNVRVNKEVKVKASQIADSLGLSLSTAVNMLLEQIVIQKGMPFVVTKKHGSAVKEINDKLNSLTEDIEE